MEWKTILLSAFGIVFTTLFTWGIERLIVYINNKLSNAKYSKYVKIALEIIARAVKTTYQTFVKEKKKNNNFTKEDKIEALKKAEESAINQMSQDIKKYIIKNFGDLDKWVENMIESVIYDLKNTDNKTKL